MQTKHPKIKKYWIALVIASATCALMTLVVSSGFFGKLQNSFADHLYHPRQPSHDIVIIKIDDRTLDENTGLGAFTNWNRSYYQKVIENINQYQPAVIAMDIYIKSQKDPQIDEQFAESLKNVKKPIIIYPSNPETFNGQYHINENYDTAAPIPQLLTVPNIILSINNILPDSDDIIRKVLPGIFNKSKNIFEESYSFQIVKNFIGAQDLSLDQKIQNSAYTFAMPTGKKVSVPLQNGQMLVNYASVPNDSKFSYPTISFIDAYKNNFGAQNPANIFRDKIVLIGTSANYFQDLYFTPINNQTRMPGVEIHANAIQTILEQKFLRNESQTEKMIVLLILALGAAFIFMYTKIRWSVLAVIATPALYALAAQPAFNNGIIIDLIHPFLALPTVFIASYIYRYLTEFKSKLALQSAFGKYVNPAIVKQISEHPENLHLGGEKREITVLFTDIAHFTSISEKLKPESLVALLNEYFEAMSQVILNEGGTLDKFEGDAIMAFFGAPLAQSDHAHRATRVALNMRLTLNALLEKWKNDAPLPGGEPKPQIDFRCGLSSGEAIVGNMGSSARFDYTAMGDIVNLGSRLEGANKKYNTHVMMSQKTHDIIANDFETRELDIIQVVGKQEPIKVFELLAPKGQLPAAALTLLQQYGQAIELYHARKFAEALAKFQEILKTFPDDGPSQLYRQRCEVLQNFPPKPDWNGVFEMGSK